MPDNKTSNIKTHRLSNPILSLNFSIIGSVPPLKRPPAPKSPPLAPDTLRKEGAVQLWAGGVLGGAVSMHCISAVTAEAGHTDGACHF